MTSRHAQESGGATPQEIICTTIVFRRSMSCRRYGIEREEL